MTGEPRYQPHAGNHVGADHVCLDCGAIIADQAAHTRFHSILSGHAWALAVLRTAHIGPAAHNRYNVRERIDSKHFDSWSADALAEVVAGRDTTGGTT